MRLGSVSHALLLAVFAGCPPTVEKVSPPSPACEFPAVDLVPAFGFTGVSAQFNVPGPTETCDAATPSETWAMGPNGERVLLSAFRVHGEVSAGGQPVNVFSAAASFRPPFAGAWTVQVTWSTGDVTTRDVTVVANQNLQASTLRYVDRMDACNRGPYRTPSGLVLCQRTVTISVYKPDGTLDHAFHGNELVVRGDEVWSNQGDQLEHRTDVLGQLRVDGVIATGPSTGVEAETQPGVAYRLLANGDVLEARWDGVQLTSQIHPGVPDFPLHSGFLIFEGPNAIWNDSFDTCLFERGCQQIACPSVQSCLGGLGALAQFGDADTLWHLRGFRNRRSTLLQLTATPRPLRLGGPRAQVTVDVGGVASTTESNRARGSERPRVLVIHTVLLPRIEAGQIQLTAFTVDGELQSITDDWVISAPSPFVLNFAPTPPRN